LKTTSGTTSRTDKQTKNEHLVAFHEPRLAGNEHWLAWNEQLASSVGVPGMTG
jgi:hypothetical protein